MRYTVKQPFRMLAKTQINLVGMSAGAISGASSHRCCYSRSPQLCVPRYSWYPRFADTAFHYVYFSIFLVLHVVGYFHLVFRIAPDFLITQAYRWKCEKCISDQSKPSILHGGAIVKMYGGLAKQAERERPICSHATISRAISCLLPL